jgi:hypothetical protein
LSSVKISIFIETLFRQELVKSNGWGNFIYGNFPRELLIFFLALGFKDSYFALGANQTFVFKGSLMSRLMLRVSPK